MGVERRGTIWADNAQVREPVVIGDAIAVVEDQRHAVSVPNLALPAQLTLSLLDSVLEQAGLEMGTRVSGSLDEYPLQGDRVSS
jgi:hypothetical protein